MATTVAVIGAGSWGTALGSLLATHADVLLWARRPEVAEAIRTGGTNPTYLPRVALPARLQASSVLAEVVGPAEVVVMAVPSHGFRAVLSEAAASLAEGVPVISLTKGLEEGTRRRMSEIVAEVVPTSPCAVLTGPNLSSEIVDGHPAASVLASSDAGVGADLQALCTAGTLRVYTNDDVIGCEVAGAAKNVIALAAGMGDGMGFGDNAKAALVTRGLAELTRLGVALGGSPLTFSGLAGVGDLVATCTSPHSRNRWVGEQLGRGRPLDEVLAETQMVAEGVRTSTVIVELAAELGVEVPIAEQVDAVCQGTRSPSEALAVMLARHAGDELHGLRS